MSWVRYTPAARQAVLEARAEAERHGRLDVDSGYLLVGILRQPESLARRYLEGMGIAEAIVPAREPADKGEGEETPKLTDEAKRGLKIAEIESDSRRHRYIGTEHLILGMLREPSSVAGGLLREGGLSVEATRQALTVLSTKLPSDMRAADTSPVGLVERLKSWFRT